MLIILLMWNKIELFRNAPENSPGINIIFVWECFLSSKINPSNPRENEIEFEMKQYNFSSFIAYFDIYDQILCFIAR